MAIVMTDYEFIEKARLAAARQTLYVKGGFGAPLTASMKARCIKAYEYNRRTEVRRKIETASESTFAFDCIGLIKGILWGWTANTDKLYGGAVYASNDVPDGNELSFINMCSSVSADFSDITPGEMLYTTGHCGIYIGGAFAIECTPKWDGNVQMTVVSNILMKTEATKQRLWLKHGKLPFIKYDTKPAPEPDEFQFSFKEVNAGSNNSDVKLVQTILKGLGLKGADKKALAVDGIFGSNTEHAVKIFQEMTGHTVDGIVGRFTWAELLYKE